MTRKSWMWLVVLAFIAVALFAGSIIAQQILDEPKVTLCHKSPKNPSQTITVAQSAVAAHQAHGDTLGPCPASPSQ